MFEQVSRRVSGFVGTPFATISAISLVVVWAIAGPFLGFSSQWQLFINTTTTIITFIMVFLIQSSQNTDTKALHLKLDELIHATESARDEFIHLEEESQEDIEQMKEAVDQ